MYKKALKVFAVISTVVMITSSSYISIDTGSIETSVGVVDNTPDPIITEEPKKEEVVVAKVGEIKSEAPPDIPEDVPEEPVSPLSQSDIDLLALVTMAEAEGEPENGKRLVIDTILNRVDSEVFPDTVKDVVYQKNQFTSMWNGRVERCYVREDIRQLVIEESIDRLNDDVIFFTAGKYGKYGTPMFQVKNHYFSSY